MAEATQATTQTDVPVTAATTSSELPPSGEQTASETATQGEQTATPTTAFERAAAAIEKQAKAKTESEKTDESEPAKEPEKEAAKPAEEKPPEPEKKEDPRLSRGLAILAEREERARKLEQRAQTVLKEAEAKAASLSAADSADLGVVRSVRAAIANGDQLAALETLGIDLPRAVELMSRRADPTPEDLQRKIVREELEAREKARADAEAKAAAEKAEREKAAEEVQRTEFLDKVWALDGGKYPFTTHRKVNGGQIWEYQKHMAAELGRQPTAVETMDRIEKFLRDDYEAGQRLLKPAEPPPAPAPTAAKASETPKPKAPEKGSEPAEQRSRKPGKRESASERAEAALRRAGYS
jgi:colicin import membrane protein